MKERDKQFTYFLGIAKGSAGELRSQLYIALDLNYINELEFEKLSASVTSVSKMIYGLMQGVQLAIGAGAWSSLSDRNLKTDVQAIDTRALLDRLIAIPVQEWSYIAQGANVRHIGPMAQDFKSAFSFGENDTTISTVDADGVALAAIQGLNQKLEAEKAALRANDQAMQAELAELRTLIETQGTGHRWTCASEARTHGSDV